MFLFLTCRPPYPIVVCDSTENRKADVQESTFSTHSAPLSYFRRNQNIMKYTVPKNNQLNRKPTEYKAHTHRHFASMNEVKKSAKNLSLF